MNDFNYNLDESLIAYYPVENRSNSKLLINISENYEIDFFYNIDKYLPDSSILIRNNTKVINARLYLKNSEGKNFEFFIINLPKNNDYTNNWTVECLIKNPKKIKNINDISSEVKIKERTIKLKVINLIQKDSYFEATFETSENFNSFIEVIDLFGSVPLPPYIKREAIESDKIKYQTTYAKVAGSVAAPTAGLHFTPDVDKKLIEKNIKILEVLLHVGIGTFKPLKSNDYHSHKMHSEYIAISKNTVSELANLKKESIIAVGTTTLRTLESFYLLAHSINQNKNHNFFISQFEYENINSFLPPTEAWNILLNYMNSQNLLELNAQTALMISPEYTCQTIDYLITNFHQPNSTLLLIVASLIGAEWKAMYNFAIDNKLRFLSYGDANLLKNKRKTQSNQ